MHDVYKFIFICNVPPTSLGLTTSLCIDPLYTCFSTRWRPNPALVSKFDKEGIIYRTTLMLPL